MFGGVSYFKVTVLPYLELLRDNICYPIANAGDTGSIPGPGKSHMPRSN